MIERLYKFDESKEKLEQKCKIESKDKKEIKRYWVIFKRLESRMKKILIYILAKELRRTLEKITLENKAINLRMLLEELVKIETTKTECIDALALQNKILSRESVLILTQNKSFQKHTIKILKINQKFLIALKRAFTFKHIPLELNQKDHFKSDASEIIMKLKNLLSSKKSRPFSRRLDKLIKMEEDFINKIVLCAKKNLSTNISDQDFLAINEKIMDIRNMDIDVVEVMYLIDIEFRFKERNQKRKTEIIGKFHDKLKELESIIPKESFSKQMKKNKTIKLRSCV